MQWPQESLAPPSSDAQVQDRRVLHEDIGQPGAAQVHFSRTALDSCLPAHVAGAHVRCISVESSLFSGAAVSFGV